MADAVSTKQALAKGLKATLEHKSLDRVTVGDITTFCGLNRRPSTTILWTSTPC